MTPSKPIQILTIVGNPRRSSRTRTAGEAVASAIARWLHDQGIQTERETLETIDLAGAGLFTGDDPDVAAAVTQTRSADLLVVATPTYKASYTGLLKAFLDNIPSDGLQGRLAVPLMVGAAPLHYLAPDAFLRPVLLALGATCPTPSLFVLESDFAALDDVIQPWLETAQLGLKALTA